MRRKVEDMKKRKYVLEGSKRINDRSREKHERGKENYKILCQRVRTLRKKTQKRQMIVNKEKKKRRRKGQVKIVK